MGWRQRGLAAAWNEDGLRCRCTHRSCMKPSGALYISASVPCVCSVGEPARSICLGPDRVVWVELGRIGGSVCLDPWTCKRCHSDNSHKRRHERPHRKGTRC